MRKTVVVALVLALAAALAGAAVTIAGEGAAPKETPAAAPDRPEAAFVRAAEQRRADRARPGGHGHRGGHRHARMLLRGLAERLDVSPRVLRAAIHGVKRRTLDRAVERGTITAAQRDALLACRGHRDCDRAAAHDAFRALRAEIEPEALAARKQELAADLGAELGKTEAQILEAVRAELVAKLDLGQRLGMVTDRARELALACFDRPAECDLRALRWEVGLGMFRKHRR